MSYGKTNIFQANLLPFTNILSQNIRHYFLLFRYISRNHFRSYCDAATSSLCLFVPVVRLVRRLGLTTWRAREEPGSDEDEEGGRGTSGKGKSRRDVDECISVYSRHIGVFHYEIIFHSLLVA